MKIEKIINKLKRDILANPQKGAVLGVLLLVCAWFWGPLVSKRLGTGKDSAEVSVAAHASAPQPIASNAVAISPLPQVPAPGTNQPPGISAWNDIRLAIAGDSRMQPAYYTPSWQDPFRGRKVTPVVVRPAPESPADGSTEEPEEEIDAASLGLSLTSLVDGPRGKMVGIGGKMYREGNWIPLAGETAADAIRCRVKRIMSKSVELEVDGTKTTLLFNTQQLAESDRIVPHGK